MTITDTIKAVQRKLGLDVDGDAGPQTWGAIASRLGLAVMPLSPEFGGGDATDLVGIAVSQIGTKEDAAHTNRGEAIRKYQESTSLEGQGWPWCAAFVDWCLQQFLARHMEYARRGLKRAQTASAFGLIEWGREQNCLVFHPQDRGHLAGVDPQPGDIVVYTFSHCGIVRDVDLDQETFHAIEGNSNSDGGRDGYEVVSHARNFGSVNRFIRLPA